MTHFKNFDIINRHLSVGPQIGVTSSCITEKGNLAPEHKMGLSKMEYPVLREDPSVVEEFHGTQIRDPFRWLENADSEEVKQFVEAQNAVTNPFLEKCEVRGAIETRLTKLWNYPKYSCPTKRGSRYFYFKNTGLQNQRYKLAFKFKSNHCLFHLVRV